MATVVFQELRSAAFIIFHGAAYACLIERVVSYLVR